MKTIQPQKPVSHWCHPVNKPETHHLCERPGSPLHRTAYIWQRDTYVTCQCPCHGEKK